MSMSAKARRCVADTWPPLGRAVRDLRDYVHDRTSAAVDTGYGFAISGNRSMGARRFEVETTELMINELRSRDFLIDVGANIGYYTCLALACKRQAIAFEPSPRNVRRLMRNLVANGYRSGFEVIPVALSDRAGVLELYGRDTGASLLRGWSGASDVDVELVPIATLDTLLGYRLCEKRLLIKVDVEGAELLMLRGATIMLSAKPRPLWVVEICFDDHRTGHVNPHFQEVFALFWELGYDAWTLERTPRKVESNDVLEWVRAGRQGFGTHNYVFRC